jgi:hypothetical protein
MFHRIASEYVAMSISVTSVAVCVVMLCISFLSADDEPNTVFLHVSSAHEEQKCTHQSVAEQNKVHECFILQSWRDYVDV